ncbi:ATP-binding protein [Nocardioides sp. GY 10127]|uniref:ATP-binding protein n=1 Tax=Nocardioides sp. GY 10127 TaxID=2569762 RepID=UPI0014581D24|nr:ATP-binding protein [Nocardioides sp. GY 10127]
MDVAEARSDERGAGGTTPRRDVPSRPRSAPRPTSEAAPPGSPWAGFTPALRAVGVVVVCVFYLALVVSGVLAGRQHAHSDGIWPTAGAGILLLLTLEGRRARALGLAGIAVGSLLVATLIDAEPLLSTRGTLNSLLVAWLGTWLLERWRLTPDTANAADLLARVPFVRTLGALGLASVAGAVLATAVTAVTGYEVVPIDVLVWAGRNLTAAAYVVIPAIVVGDLRRQGRTWRTEFGPLGVRGWLSFAGLSAIAVAAWTASMTRDDALVFLVLPVGTWIAARYSPMVAAAWVVAFGGLVVTLTTRSFVIFNDLDVVELRMLLLQLFLLTLLTAVFATSTVTEERRRLVAALLERDRERSSRLELLDSITDSIAEALLVFGADGRLVTANATARSWAARTEGGLQDHSSRFVLHRMDGERLPPEEYPSRRALRDGLAPPQDLLIDTSLGRLTVQAQAVRLRERTAWGEESQVLVVLTDVSEVRARAKKLSGFAGRVRDDLADPLTAARDWAALARTHLAPAADGKPVDAARAGRAVERIDLALVRMGDLVEELLVRTRVEAGPVKPERVELDGFLGLVRQVADGEVPGARVRVGQVPAVSADREMVAELLAQLLRSAVHRVSDGTTPVLAVSGAEVASRVVLTITDNGAALPEEWHERVFSRFVRLPSPDDSDAAGVLGLALARSIVERHGGSIRVETLDRAEGGVPGSRVVLDLPAAGPVDGL